MHNIRSSIYAAVLIFLLLLAVQIVPSKPILLLERLFVGGGWLQLVLAMIYGATLVWLMQNRKTRSVWRKRAWILFSIVFFGQLLLGIFVDAFFLMTGNLHFPIPAVILAGPIYRFEVSFMPILFLSTLLLSGPAWCSQLCYFGALDALASSYNHIRKGKIKRFAYHKSLKYTVFFVVVLSALSFRLFGFSSLVAAIFAAIFGIVSVVIIFVVSRQQEKMVHCSSFCPIGTVVAFGKKISPFRICITKSCTQCMACTKRCKYDALNSDEIKKGVVGYTCTYCGDCLAACHHNAIEYHFLGLSAKAAEQLWIIVTVVLHTCFLVIARI